eukprot:Awhi_evm1s9739
MFLWALLSLVLPMFPVGRTSDSNAQRRHYCHLFFQPETLEEQVTVVPKETLVEQEVETKEEEPETLEEQVTVVPKED